MEIRKNSIEKQSSCMRLFAALALAVSMLPVGALPASADETGASSKTGQLAEVVQETSDAADSDSLDAMNEEALATLAATGLEVKQLATNTTCMAILSDGSLWTWGSNYNGQLGRDTDGSDDPIPAKVLDSVASVETYFDFVYAIKTDGSLWTWGSNSYGQLGRETEKDEDGDYSSDPMPTQVVFGTAAGDVSKATVTAIADQVYTGSTITPAVTVTLDGKELVAGTDYTLSYANNVEVGTATVTVTGRNYFTGSLTATFNIVKAGGGGEGNSGGSESGNEGSSGGSGTGTGSGSGAETPVATQAMYRLYNPNSGDHHYTTSTVERDYLDGIGWNYEGIGWYSDDNQGQALYRLYNPNAVTATHHYTASTVERDWLVSLGWRAEGIAWYGVKQ